MKVKLELNIDNATAIVALEGEEPRTSVHHHGKLEDVTVVIYGYQWLSFAGESAARYLLAGYYLGMANRIEAGKDERG